VPPASTTPGGYGDYNISANADTKVIQVSKGLAFIDLRKKQPLAQVQKIPTANAENATQIQLPEGACIQISFLQQHILKAQLFYVLKSKLENLLEQAKTIQIQII